MMVFSVLVLRATIFDLYSIFLDEYDTLTDISAISLLDHIGSMYLRCASFASIQSCCPQSWSFG
jgi:hypothetical protein